MLSQADLKRYRALQQKKFRGESQRYLVQGRKVVAEALRSKVKLEAILASETEAAWVREAALTRAVAVHVLAQHELDKVGTLEKGNDLIAIACEPAPIPFRPLAAGELALALDGIRDPRNLGSLLRIADWFGVSQVICSHDCMELYNPKVVSSTMGSIFRIPVRHANLPRELTQLRAGGATIYMADMDGTSVYAAELVRPAVLVLGSESHGLSAAVESLAAQVLSIPRLGGAESLNVAMAASALCSEFARRPLTVLR
jgi:RNA methyltransferase, TrmH family